MPGEDTTNSWAFSERVWGQPGRVLIWLQQPDFTASKVFDQFPIANLVHFPCPNDFGVVDIRLVVNPLLKRGIVAWAISYDDDVAVSGLSPFLQQTRAFQVPRLTRIPGPVQGRRLHVERFRARPDAEDQNAHEQDRADKHPSHRLPAPFPNPQVAHRLQQENVDHGGQGGPHSEDKTIPL